MLEIKTFGERSIQFFGEPISSLPARKAEALLIYLTVEQETTHRRESLFTLLWPGMPEKSARHNLRQLLYALRQTFPEMGTVPLLLADRQTIRINPLAQVIVDVHQLDQLLEGTQIHEHLNLESCERCLPALEAAVDLYRGEFLCGFYLEDSNPFEDWVQANREAYRQKVLGTLQTLTEIALQKQDYEQARHFVEQELSIDNLRESAHRQMMEVLALSGHRAKALRQYRDCEAILKNELGIAPSTMTIILHEQIRTESLPASEVDRLAQPPPIPHHNLPHSLTSFIGRQQEINEIAQLLKHHRLVTLTGSGGIGKTQLALQASRGLLEAFPDGVWFIDLAPLSDSKLVPQTVAYALGLWDSPNRPILEHLTEYLLDKDCLLILDNCEHLITAAAQFANTVLQTCPAVKILASSRETLGVPGEMAYMIQPLSVPNKDQLLTFDEWKQFEALLLFAERARDVLPSFQVTQDNYVPLVQICQRLDGIPLALELAAARVKILAVKEIATRLDDCFPLLTKGSRTAPERQKTLRASIEWSWALLSIPEQELMCRVSVFSGGMNLKAVEAICTGNGIDKAEILDLLNQLVNKNLVIAQRQQGQETRYRLLETIRQYAQEKLTAEGLEDMFRDRHLVISGSRRRSKGGSGRGGSGCLAGSIGNRIG